MRTRGKTKKTIQVEQAMLEWIATNPTDSFERAELKTYLQTTFEHKKYTQKSVDLIMQKALKQLLSIGMLSRGNSLGQYVRSQDFQNEVNLSQKRRSSIPAQKPMQQPLPSQQPDLSEARVTELAIGRGVVQHINELNKKIEELQKGGGFKVEELKGQLATMDRDRQNLKQKIAELNDVLIEKERVIEGLENYLSRLSGGKTLNLKDLGIKIN